MKIKSIIVFIAVTATFSLPVQAQKIDASKVPSGVKNNFKKQFPHSIAKWEKENGGYEANFKQNGNSMSAMFDAGGVFTESEMGIKITALPTNVLAYLKEHYKGKAIKEGAKITKADGTINYEANVNGKDVIFDANGNFIKEVKA